VDPERPEEGGRHFCEIADESRGHLYYANEDLVHMPHFWELANDPLLLYIIEKTFGAKPTISYASVWWLLPGIARMADTDEVHRDVDDWAEMKLFFYLNDIDEESGPHAFVRGSHTWRLPTRRRSLNLANSEWPIVDNLVVLTGRSGLAWLENSYGLHQATIPKKKNRLMASVTYTLFPLPFGPKLPLASGLNNARFDPYI